MAATVVMTRLPERIRFTEEGVVGAIDSTVCSRHAPRAQGETDGFTLCVTVKGSGKQCVNVICGAFPRANSSRSSSNDGVVYVVLDDASVVIAAVAHARRLPKYWF